MSTPTKLHAFANDARTRDGQNETTQKDAISAEGLFMVSLVAVTLTVFFIWGCYLDVLDMRKRPEEVPLHCSADTECPRRFYCAEISTEKLLPADPVSKACRCDSVLGFTGKDCKEFTRHGTLLLPSWAFNVMVCTCSIWVLSSFLHQGWNQKKMDMTMRHKTAINLLGFSTWLATAYSVLCIMSLFERSVVVLDSWHRVILGCCSAPPLVLYIMIVCRVMAFWFSTIRKFGPQLSHAYASRFIQYATNPALVLFWLGIAGAGIAGVYSERGSGGSRLQNIWPHREGITNPSPIFGVGKPLLVFSILIGVVCLMHSWTLRAAVHQPELSSALAKHLEIKIHRERLQVGSTPCLDTFQNFTGYRRSMNRPHHPQVQSSVDIQHPNQHAMVSYQHILKEAVQVEVHWAMQLVATFAILVIVTFVILTVGKYGPGASWEWSLAYSCKVWNSWALQGLSFALYVRKGSLHREERKFSPGHHHLAGRREATRLIDSGIITVPVTPSTVVTLQGKGIPSHSSRASKSVIAVEDLSQVQPPSSLRNIMKEHKDEAHFAPGSYCERGDEGGEVPYPHQDVIAEVTHHNKSGCCTLESDEDKEQDRQSSHHSWYPQPHNCIFTYRGQTD